MIHDGIYEEIVSSKLQRELSKLDLNKYVIQIERLDSKDAKYTLTIYLSIIIKRALLYIRDSANEDEALLEQIKLCNEIIETIKKHTNEYDLDELKIVEKGEVLKSLYQKINKIKRDRVRPLSLVENLLFTGAKVEPDLLSEIKKEILSADEVVLFVSFIKFSAYLKLERELEEFTLRDDSRLRVIATTYTKATDYKTIVELSKLKNCEVKINYDTSHIRMHAKAYIFKRRNGFSTAYIGSSNLSKQALTDGLEWNIKVTERESRLSL